jgi:hypothetical protein
MSRTLIQHTLWVIDAGARDFRYKTIPDAVRILNTVFFPNCLGDVGTNFTIDAAIAQQATGTITPGAFDAVVFLVRDVTQSLPVTKLSQTLTPTTVTNSKVLGNTWLGLAGGDLAEVFWDRVYSNQEAANSIFHEAAHLKSGQGDAMHTATVGAPHGGPGLKVLAAQGGGVINPSGDDFDFYMKAITSRITLRTKIP